MNFHGIFWSKKFGVAGASGTFIFGLSPKKVHPFPTCEVKITCFFEIHTLKIFYFFFFFFVKNSVFKLFHTNEKTMKNESQKVLF